ncbi:MAG: VWA domain-containing protein [Bryobacteraceae bacterium]|nr:VWA domain-containing protein [Bryobacteraceae bacterium]
MGNVNALPLFFVIVMAAYASQQPPLAAPDRDPEPFRISMDVALVVLHATVIDRQGGFVSDLNRQDFEVFEDGKPQEIRVFTNEDVPVTAGLVVDHSSSMQPKLTEVTAAARTFVKLSNREDEMFVVNFNEHVSLGLPAKVRFTDDIAQLEDAIAAAPAAGQTALYDAIAKALDELNAGSRDKKVLIVVSDGGDNASALSQAQVMKLAGQSSAVIYTIGIFDEDDADRNPAMLRHLAQVTGGEAFLVEQVSEIVAVSKRIARDIRHQYTIGYVPAAGARDGASHTIRVLAHAKGHERLSVRTRTSYIAGGERGLAEKSAQ